MESKRGSESFWAGHVRGWRESGLTQTKYCALRGLSVHALRYWCTRIKPGTPGVLSLVPVQRGEEVPRQVKGCVVRGSNGVAIAFSELPAPSYLVQLLKM